MPEGPSMVFLKEKLSPFIGQKVIEVNGDSPKLAIKKLLNLKITDIKTYGKEIFICFQEISVRIHLMLFGSYLINSKKDGKLKLGLKLKEGEINFYACNVSLITEPLDSLYDWSVDVMNDKWDREKAKNKLKDISDSLICDALLDQHIFAGVGNKLKDELLFDAKIHPESLVGKVPEKKIKAIFDIVVDKSFEYLKWDKEGRPDGFLKVHKQDLCPVHNIKLSSKTLGKTKRKTEFCEICQKLYK